MNGGADVMQKTDILIVEDDTLVGEVTRAILANKGFSARLVPNSLAALALIKSSPPKLILADIMLPGISGLQLCKLVTSNPDLAQVKVVIMSAKAFETEIARARALGASAFLAKPFSKEELLAAVTPLLKP